MTASGCFLEQSYRRLVPMLRLAFTRRIMAGEFVLGPRTAFGRRAFEVLDSLGEIGWDNLARDIEVGEPMNSGLECVLGGTLQPLEALLPVDWHDNPTHVGKVPQRHCMFGIWQ